MKSQVIMVIWISTFLFVSVLAADCPYKECDCIGETIGCENKGLKNIPTLVSTSSTGFIYLIFSINYITTVPAGSLPTNLQSISFLNNPIMTIDVNALNGSATTLASLAFSYANFTKISDALLYVQALTDLSLSNMNIQDWNEDAMKHLGLTMKTLSLDNVSLSAWPDWLKYFSQLTELSITDSSLSIIPQGGLDMGANTLTSLTLDRNKFTSVPSAMLSLLSLQMFSIQNNAVYDLTSLPPASKLMSISLSSNNISNVDQLSTVLQPYADSLNDIALDHNQLIQIPDFYFLEQVGSLDFSNNRISDSLSGSVPINLFELDLEYNQLESIPAIMASVQSVTDFSIPNNRIKAIHGNEYSALVTGLDVGYNLITTITSACFPNASLITTLRLNDNPITTISDDAFNSLSHLKELYLGNTRITRLPLSLASLSSLKIFDVTDSANLVCTCGENRLAPWVKTFPSEDFRGDCGSNERISVYNFFMTLAPSCPYNWEVIIG